VIAVRAYGEVAKDARRQVILDAAAALFEEKRSLPTASAIAEASNLAKGTIYRYFESREEIFTTLVLEWWSAALDELETDIGSAGTAREAREIFPAQFCGLITNRPLLMQLDSILPDLKSTMSEASRERFGGALNARLAISGECLEAVLDLPVGRGVQLLLRCHAFSRGLWQSFGHLEKMACSAEQIPAFSIELHDAISEYWRGALS
jgi:AcrR family transcriptional regulator